MLELLLLLSLIILIAIVYKPLSRVILGALDGHAAKVRTELDQAKRLRLAGIDQRAAMEAGEGAWAVTDLAIKYLRPAKLDDDLTVVSTVEAVRGASVIIAQRILRGQDELTPEVLTGGRVTAAFLSPEGRPRRQPAGWAERFTAIMNGETNPC